MGDTLPTARIRALRHKATYVRELAGMCRDQRVALNLLNYALEVDADILKLEAEVRTAAHKAPVDTSSSDTLMAKR
jgi:hypothetical protein